MCKLQWFYRLTTPFDENSNKEREIIKFLNQILIGTEEKLNQLFS